VTRFLLALQFLSILPVRLGGTPAEDDLASSTRYYPLVGMVLGALSGAFFWIGQDLFSPLAAAVLAVATLAVLTGGLHLDGFADMCDGFCGTRDRARTLLIMKDSRSGPMAVVGVFCLLALKIAFLSALEPSDAFRTLVVAATAGRWAMVWLCARSTYARPEGGTASPYIGRVDKSTLATATVLGATIILLFSGLRGLLLLPAVIGGAWLFRRFTEKRLGGLTGDTLGACCELIELLSLAILSARGVL
jgi:adenosylcobinamide-GDP ribazoletransferase